MERDKASPEEQKARLPNQTFRDRITLYLGDKEIQVLYLGRAHTRGDSIIYVPQDRIVYLSEIFSAGQFLFMGEAQLKPEVADLMSRAGHPSCQYRPY
jgi:glyoxylase-like metal-dependent hydrolase (beta-lactamase superfamily II)